MMEPPRKSLLRCTYDLLVENLETLMNPTSTTTTMERFLDAVDCLELLDAQQSEVLPCLQLQHLATQSDTGCI
jgi:hypothetical protein